MSEHDLDFLQSIKPRNSLSLTVIILATKAQVVKSAMANVTKPAFKVLAYDDRYELLYEYAPLSDESWREIKLAFVVHPPYVFHIGGGRFVGTPFDIWKILASKLKLQLKFVYTEDFKQMFDMVRIRSSGLVKKCTSILV